LIDEWMLEELIAGVGDIGRSAAFKALVTSVKMGVLKEDRENVFVPLERAEEDGRIARLREVEINPTSCQMSRQGLSSAILFSIHRAMEI
jgi:hypothetical protein